MLILLVMIGLVVALGVAVVAVRQKRAHELEAYAQTDGAHLTTVDPTALEIETDDTCCVGHDCSCDCVDIAPEGHSMPEAADLLQDVRRLGKPH